MNRIYLTPANSGISEIVEKRSKFIGNITHISSEENAISYIKSIKKKYYDAKHNAYAYIFENTKRYSDDGEPAKTAGLPILDMLSNQGITDVVCVVTRYFGGVLLGTGGLVRAYTSAAKSALENAGVKEMRLHNSFNINIPYHLYDNVKYIINECNCHITDTLFTDKIVVSAVCENEYYENALQRMKDTFGININIENIGEIFL